LPPNCHTGAGPIAFEETFERLTGNCYRINVRRNDNECEMVESVQIGNRD